MKHIKHLFILAALTLLFGASTTLAQATRTQIAKKLIQKDASLLEIYESPAGVEERLDIKSIDLNGDKNPEFIVSGILCGAQNCSFFIFQKRGNGIVQIPSEIEGVFIKALTTRSKGWRDLVFAYHSSATREPRTTYRFNGKKYIARK